ncbi:MAG: CehA/McbA family metallohydrolase [Myxococcota bacterium]|nr:CehA/McbA family metallohydrolase [Myxococcota bacterium]
MTGCLVGLAFAALLGSAGVAGAELVAERITPDNAARHLFGGTDADGGIGDWYLSNGVVEAVIDHVGPQPDLPDGVTGPVLQSEAAPSGGTVVDLGLVGADNDQLNHFFTVGGLSASNFVVYDSISASVTETEAAVRVVGTVLGFALTPEELVLETLYVVREGEPFLTVLTTAENRGPFVAPFLGGFLDVMPWTTRALVPFTPLPGNGFRHAVLDIANPGLSLETPAWTVAPGNVGPADGVMDPATGARAGEVSYGLVPIRAIVDLDGDGPQPPTEFVVRKLFGPSGVEATAQGNLPVVGGLFAGNVLTYERRLYVGDRNDVASAANLFLPLVGERLGFATGTISGDVDALGAPDVVAAGIATRTGGPPIAELPDGSPTTHFRTDASGAFAGVALPEGRYQIELRAPERDPVLVSDVVVAPDADTVVAVPPLGATGTLVLRVREPGPLRRIPAKVTIAGLGDTPDPRFGREFDAIEVQPDGSEVDLRADTFGSALAQANFVYLPDGRGEVALRPGRYEVFASRGPEYSVARRVLRVRAGRGAKLDVVLERLVPTPDALSADFHIHSARSLDSSASPESRVVSFAAEGVDVMIGTDHDFVLDYGPAIASRGLGGQVASIVGTEVTTTVPNPPVFPDAVGHLNAWPLEARSAARKGGAIEDEFVAPNWIYSRLRGAGARVIQYNHLRAGVRGLGSIGFFNNIACNRCENDESLTCSADAQCPNDGGPRRCTCLGYRPDRPITAFPNDVLLDDDVTGDSGVPNPDGLRNIDFDVMEVANGLNIVGFLELRNDWFSLLNQAFQPTPSGPVPFLPATGVSDSHRNTLESAGYFRTYVLGSGDDPAALDRAAFDDAVRAGRMVATTGPWIELWARDAGDAAAGIGDTLVPESGTVRLALRVLASNWIPVDEVRVIANGAVVARFDAATEPAVRPAPARPWGRSDARVVRFDAEIELALETDAWLVVEAGARLDPLPEPDPFASRLVPGLIPFAFTNPVFVDLAGDGFDAPGIPPLGGGGSAASRPPWEHPTYRAQELRHHLPLRLFDPLNPRR